MNTQRASFGRPPAAFGRSKMSAAEKLETRAGRTGASGKVAMLTGATIAKIPVPPWTQIIGAGVMAVGGALQIGSALSTRGAKALTGDRSAVQGYAKRAKRWSSSKRGRKADRLLKRWKRLKGTRRSKKGWASMKKRLALLKMKMEVLYGLEAASRGAAKKGKGSGTRTLVKDDDGPRVLPRDDDDGYDDDGSYDDEEDGWITPSNTPLLIGGAALGAVLLGILLTRTKPTA